MIEGRLDRLHLGDLLQWLQMGSLSGRLSLDVGGWERRIDFLDGRVVFVSSLVPQERLATWLAHERQLDVARLRPALALSLLRRTSFIDLLLQQDLISADALKDALRQLARHVTRRLLATDRVRFKLDTAFPVRDLLGMSIDLEPHRLLLEAARLSDETLEQEPLGEPAGLPFAGELFESLFWNLIREGVGQEEPIPGASLAELHDLLRNITGTLSQWLSSSPGLVPVPSGHIFHIAGQLASQQAVILDGLPQATWNQMVLGRSVHSSDAPSLHTLHELSRQADRLDLWLELTGSQTWHRPHAVRLDDLTRKATVTWSRAAGAAAEVLDVEPGTAALAAHLLVVPTDLVLWVLATLPVGHRGVRKALLRHLPRRLGVGLARIAHFPEVFRELFEPNRASALGASLHMARSCLSSSSVWPPTLPGDEGQLLEVATPSVLSSAAAAAREAVEGPAEEPVRLG